MPVPSFTLLAHKCWCQSCYNLAHGDLGLAAGQVTGHGNGAGEWSCVYCGGPVTRSTPWYASLYQSLRSWYGWCVWEIKVTYMLFSLNTLLIRIGV